MTGAAVARPRADRWILLHTGLVYVFLWAPIAVLVLFSFNSSRQVVVWEQASLHWYRVLMDDTVLLSSLRRSVWIALLTTALSVLIGTPAALAMSRYRFPGKALFAALVDLPIIVPEIVMASSLLIFFGLLGVRLSMTTVVIAHVVFSVSYLIMTVRARLAGFDRTLEEAAMDLGASEVQTFFRITLPLTLPGIVSGALLVFTISLDDYVITSFVAGVGSSTLPLQIYSMVKQGISPEINAVSTLMLALTITLIVVSQLLQREERA
jgi:spermidine/putrescine transport system permease protein